VANPRAEYVRPPAPGHHRGLGLRRRPRHRNG
jgi:hypothetical protein